MKTQLRSLFPLVPLHALHTRAKTLETLGQGVQALDPPPLSPREGFRNNPLKTIGDPRLFESFRHREAPFGGLREARAVMEQPPLRPTRARDSRWRVPGVAGRAVSNGARLGQPARFATPASNRRLPTRYQGRRGP